MSHTCHARGCEILCRPQFLMCVSHWKMVHQRLQRLVWRHYREGQYDDMRPSEEWHWAAAAAIGYVATLDDEPLLVKEMNALKEFGFTVKEHEGGLKAVLHGDA